MAPQVLISLADNVLTLYLSPDDWLSRGHCSTLTIQIECPTAADYRPGTFYQPVIVRACEGTVAEGQARCPRHWFSMFTCLAMDGNAVAVANSTQQLAEVLQLSEVRVCGAVSKQPLSLPGCAPRDAATSLPQQQQQQQQQSSQQPTSQQTEQPMQVDQVQQTQHEPKPVLTVKVPKLGGSSSTVRSPCCTVLLMADVGSPRDCVPGNTYPVLYSWCCGRDAAGRDFCKQHEASRFVVTDKNMSIVASVSTLQLLAAVLGYSAVNITSEQQDLLQKLLSAAPASAAAAAAATGSTAGTFTPAATAAAAAAAGGGGSGQTPMSVDSPPLPPPRQQQLEVGQKRSSAEAELPSNLGNGRGPPSSRPGASAAAAAAGGGVGSSGAGSSGAGKGVKESQDSRPMSLRLTLTAEDAAQQRQVLQERRAALRQQQGPQGQQQQLAAVHVEMSQLESMASEGWDVRLPVPQGSALSAETRCLGVTLQLNVASFKQLVEARSFVQVLKGEQCSHEGGTKKACKRHKVCTFTLLSLTGQPLISATHLAGLAHRLQVSAASIVDSSGNPIPDYEKLPGTPIWQQAPDNSSLTVWLPPDAQALQGNWQTRPCNGLDVYVEQPKDVQQAVGCRRLVMSIVRCGNEAGAKATCKRHSSKVLQLYSWNDSLSSSTQLHITPGDTMIHACSDLPQLAMWLGVGKVEVLDADSKQPLPYYKGLSIPPPTQLPLTGPQALLTPPNLAPPSLSTVPGPSAVGVPTGEAAAGEAAAAAAGVAAVQLGSEGGAAGVVGGGELGSLLSETAQVGGAKAVNLFGNSKVEFLQQSPQQQQQQQQQQQVVVRVEPRPVGGNQSRPCCMLDIVLLLQSKAAYQHGQHYPVLFAHRCGNEAGNRSRCRQHSDAAVRILATDPASAQAAAAAQPMPLFALQTAKSALTHTIAAAIIQDSVLGCKVNTSRDAAAVLGVGTFQLLDAVTGQDLGDVAAWSPTNSTGTAAKVVHGSSSRDAAAAAAALAAAAAAAGVPGVPTPQALLAVLRGGRLSAGLLNAVQPNELDLSAADGRANPAFAPAAAIAPAAQASAAPAGEAGSGGGGGLSLAYAGGAGTAAAGSTAAPGSTAAAGAPADPAVQGVAQHLRDASLEQQPGSPAAAQVAGPTASPLLPPQATQAAAAAAAATAAMPPMAEQQQQQPGPPGVPAAASATVQLEGPPAAAAATAAAAPAIPAPPPGLQAPAAATKAVPGTLAAAAAAAAASGFGSSAPSHLAAWAVKFRAGTPPGPR